MTKKEKEFIELMLKKSKEKDDTEIKSPFSNLKVEDVENLTKEIMEKKPKKN
tara:strand:+ start:2088 stop:2243 length:156 start_codon:yes stop_codon:yes gene_type:complete